MKKKLLLLPFLILLITACSKKQEVTGSITGLVYTMDDDWEEKYLDGIIVEIPGTDFHCYTQNGVYELKNLPAGVYDLYIHGKNQTEYKYFDVPVVGGDKPVVMRKTRVADLPKGTLKKIFEPETTDFGNLKYKVLCESCINIMVFYMPDSEFDYTKEYPYGYAYKRENDTFEFYVGPSIFESLGNPDKIYAVVFNSSKFLVSYFDPEKHINVYSSLGEHLSAIEIKKSDFPKK